MKRDDDRRLPFNLRMFRAAALLVSVAVGLQPLVRLWRFGPAALPLLDQPLIVRGVMALSRAGSQAADLRLVFAVVIAACLVSLAVFGAASAALTSFGARPSPRKAAALLAMQTVLGSLIAQEWLYVAAAEAALVLPARSVWRWWLMQASCLVGAQLLRLGPVHPMLMCNLSGAPLPLALTSTQHTLDVLLIDVVMGLVFQALAFAVGGLGRIEQRRQAQLAAAHRHLVATRLMIRETAASAERMRVARELHDSVGHQLTAMKLHLDLAMHQTEVTPSLRAASELTQTLLAEVRAVVHAERVEERASQAAADTEVDR